MVTIDIFSHHVSISTKYNRAKQALLQLSSTLVEWTSAYVPRRGMVRKPTKVYALANEEKTIFRFHRHHLDEAKQFLTQQGIKEKQITTRTHQPVAGAAIEFKDISGKTLRKEDNQPEIVDYLASDRPTKILTLQTGKGKTFCTLKALERMGTRAMVITNARHIKTWIKSLKENIELGNRDILQINGAKAMRDLLLLGREKALEAKIIVVSSTTLRNYFTACKNYETDEYGTLPHEMFETLGVGCKIIDEAHENLHFNFIMELLTHVKTSIYLSATLVSSNTFANKILTILYPPYLRFQGAEYDRYIVAVNLEYGINSVHKLKYMSAMGYSHNRLEESIFKQSDRRHNYLTMIQGLTESIYINNRQDGHKFLIFASKIETCVAIATMLQSLYPHLKVASFNGDDDDDNFYNQDIVVSTLGSAGTGRDLPGLVATLMTIAQGSRQQAEQVLGRLRKLRGDWANITPKFYYLSCPLIEQHRKYHEKKLEYYKPLVKAHKTMRTDWRI